MVVSAEKTVKLVVFIEPECLQVEEKIINAPIRARFSLVFQLPYKKFKL